MGRRAAHRPVFRRQSSSPLACPCAARRHRLHWQVMGGPRHLRKQLSLRPSPAHATQGGGSASTCVPPGRSATPRNTLTPALSQWEWEKDLRLDAGFGFRERGCADKLSAIVTHRTNKENLMHQNISRRNMLKLGAGVAAICATGSRLFATAEVKKIPIGVQVYSVRTAAAKDTAGVLAALGKMGYQGCEFAGYYNHKAEELRKMLDDAGLKCCGTHTAWETIQEANFAATVEFNKTIGNKFLIVPSLPAKLEATPEACKETAKIFTERAAKAKEAGMRVGYHAHAQDFKKLGEQTPWEIICETAGPDVIMQLDTGNCMDGGGDPIAILKKYASRAVTIHIKPHGGAPGALFGDDTVNWKEIFTMLESAGKTEWYIVEYETDPGSLGSVQRCLEALRKMGK
jgi:sugar phosphate isomerase/epimerase